MSSGECLIGGTYYQAYAKSIAELGIEITSPYVYRIF